MNCSDILNVYAASSMKTFLYNSVHYCEILLQFHTVRQNSDLVQKLCLGNLNIKIKIKWRNLHFCVLTTSYSEGQRK